MEPAPRRSAGKAVLLIAVVLVVALLLLSPAVQGFIKDVISSPFKPRYPEEASFTLQRTLVVEANGGTVTNFTMDFPEPMDLSRDGRQLQEIIEVDYSSEIARTVRYGHNWTVWDVGTFSGTDRRTLTATYEVTARTHIWDLDASTSGNLSAIPSPLKEQYLRDEWKMTMTDPAVAALSERIVGDEDNVYLILRAIYDWVRANIDYPTGSWGAMPQDARQTLQERVGDCDDQAILFCSLARAAGVPAWLQLGALYVGLEDSWGGHGWLQAYVPLKEGGGENVVIDTVNGDFLVWRPNRFVEFTDDGTAEHLIDYYFIYYGAYDDGTYPAGKAPVFRDSYVAISYEASDRKVSQGAVFELGVRPPGMCLAPSRT